MVCALALVTLSGCATISPSTSRPTLAPIPGDIKSCINRLTGFPEGEALSQAQVQKLIVELRKSEVQKTKCGKRLIRLYESQGK